MQKSQNQINFVQFDLCSVSGFKAAKTQFKSEPTDLF